FNPRSGLIVGKQELSLGDRRGKLFHGVAPAITFDCKAGTWCFPVGLAMIGPKGADAIVHLALQFNGWDEQHDGFRHALEVEVFRLIYTEEDVPLGKNLGPARFNPDDANNEAG
ncbi:MAG: hypothetical protein GWO39_13180, partial [Gammaproteobacteria bacterium]|nr:hypothetical protein [Gammaproteobacteria bacterium]NIT64678.1 hypothetical protein [Gammaproteobacteria bacterium]NIV21639.1 hypothetical protein [Gammaproteobacteria bacterium]NIY33258.1 hypothetical protein [Gammaproteobacteria bacterium]